VLTEVRVIRKLKKIKPTVHLTLHTVNAVHNIHANVNSYCLEVNSCSHFFSSLRPCTPQLTHQQPVTSAFQHQQQSLQTGTGTTTPADHLHVVNLVDRHLQVEQPVCYYGRLFIDMRG